MKFFLVLCLIVGIVSSEAARNRQRSSRFRSRFLSRQEVAEEPEATTVAAVEEAPYPPSVSESGPYPASGWRPAGQSFELPTEQLGKADEESSPDEEYGTPAEVYGAPTPTYGPPEEETTTEAEEFTTLSPDVETVEETIESGNEKNGRLRRPLKSQRQTLQRSNQGSSFYVLLPDSTLQKIDVTPSGARINNRFSARLLQAPQSSRRQFAVFRQ